MSMTLSKNGLFLRKGRLIFAIFPPASCTAPYDFCTALAQPHLGCGTVRAPKILSRSVIPCKLAVLDKVAGTNKALRDNTFLVNLKTIKTPYLNDFLTFIRCRCFKNVYLLAGI